MHLIYWQTKHYNYQLVLNKDDGTDQFKQDATFYRVQGLADSSKVSYHSYNFPTYYIRHFNYKLRIDPIATTTDKQDATFIEH
ncbi:AbfB domain-containing protein [Paenibacillus hexagrammi]|uniref:AbfB domain-containing protein n=1 Tax=Paenibacillus hexagrammi TaxID=2908839 RepID=UPI003313090D